jgi:hypothetical protein
MFETGDDAILLQRFHVPRTQLPAQIGILAKELEPPTAQRRARNVHRWTHDDRNALCPRLQRQGTGELLNEFKVERRRQALAGGKAVRSAARLGTTVGETALNGAHGVLLKVLSVK